MLFQPCSKCGTLLKEDEPTHQVTINEHGRQKHMCLCQRCFGTVNEQQENSKLLQE